MKHHTKTIIYRIIGLMILQGILDLIFVYLYPEVNPIRATFIGLSAIIVLDLLYFIRKNLINPVIGGISIFSSALFGALLVQVGYLISKSPLSTLVHVLILIVTYLILDFVFKKK